MIQKQPTPITTNAHQDANEFRFKAVTNPDVKNPLSFTDPTDRQAATLARIQRIMSNPKYQALPKAEQVRLRSKYYDKYVVPTYQDSKFPIPDKVTWIKQVTQRNRATGGFMFGPEQYYDVQQRDDIARIGFSAAKNIGDILHGSLQAGVWVSKKVSLANLGLTEFFTHPTPEQKVDSRQAIENMAKYANKVVDRVSDTLINSSNFWLQTHPSKSFAEKADSFVGENLVQLPLYEAIGAARALAAPVKLTKVLEASKTGKIAAATLGNASDALLAGVAQGQKKHEVETNMAAFAGFGAFGESVALAASPMIKKFTAHVLSIGGRPLQEAITNEAEYELDHGMIHGHPNPHGDAVTPEHVSNALSLAIKDDSIKAKLVTAEKASLNSMAMAKYNKPLRNLSQKQRFELRQARAELVSDAVREMPAHLPQVAKANAQAAVLSSQAADPEMAAWDAAMQKKHGVDFAQSLHQAELDSVQEQTGIKSSQGVTKKVAKSSVATDEQIRKTAQVSREEEPRRYASFKIDHLAYMKNPAGAAKKGFDYKSWLEDMDSKDFLDELKTHIGNAWYFEKPQHLLEYALTYSREMPKPFKDRILEELENVDPMGDFHKWRSTGFRRDKHIEALAKTGRLFTEGNVFRSSRFEPGARYTKWQKELYREADKADHDRAVQQGLEAMNQREQALIKQNEIKETQAKMAALEKHHSDVSQMTLGVLDNLQNKIDTEEYIQYQDPDFEYAQLLMQEITEAKAAGKPLSQAYKEHVLEVMASRPDILERIKRKLE